VSSDQWFHQAEDEYGGIDDGHVLSLGGGRGFPSPGDTKRDTSE